MQCNRLCCGHTCSSLPAANRKRSSSSRRRSRASSSVAIAALSLAVTPVSHRGAPPRAMKAAKPGEGACGVALPTLRLVQRAATQKG